MRKSNLILILAIIIIAFLLYERYAEKSVSSQALEQLREVPSEIDESSGLKESDTDKINNSRQNAITTAVEMIQPAVVSVNVIKTRIVRRRTSFFFGFYDEIPYNIKGIGSGVIFNKDGYILTNSHVVEDATEIKVILTDNRQYDGKIIGIDSVHDIAVLKVNGGDLPFAKLGKSAELIIGEWAIAVGNPYGFLIKDSKPSVSVGVISAVNRDFAENEQGKIYRRMIQTDAAINQGNSGGPLVNIYGEVIGINTFIFSESGGNIGIGFSIPIDRVKKIAEELIEYGKVRDIWFGFKVQDINPMLASHLGLESLDGVLVNYVQKSSPSQKAGLQKMDIITEINGNYVRNTEDAEMAVSDISVGDKMKLRIVRDKKKISLAIDAVEYK
jgi:serine protease Do